MTRAVLLLLTVLACKVNTEPVYHVGTASYTMVNRGLTSLTFYRSGDVPMVALPGDSICTRFEADGNWQSIFVWNEYWRPYELQWAPEWPVINVALAFADNAKSLDNGPHPC